MKHVRITIEFDACQMTDEGISRIISDALVQIEEPADDVEGHTANVRHVTQYQDTP